MLYNKLWEIRCMLRRQWHACDEPEVKKNLFHSESNLMHMKHSQIDAKRAHCKVSVLANVAFHIQRKELKKLW